jgi:hypothetical protein
MADMDRKLAALFRLGLVMGLAVLASACASDPVTSDYDPGADFSRYKTFGLVDTKEFQDQQYRSLLAQRIERAVEAEMQYRGYTLVAPGETPDLAVDYHAALEDKQRIVSSPSPTPTYWGGGARWYDPWPTYANDVRTVDYKQGTIIIYLVDSATKQMVWQGMAQGTVQKKHLDNPDKAVVNAVAAIFEKYPFRAGNSVPEGK